MQFMDALILAVVMGGGFIFIIYSTIGNRFPKVTVFVFEKGNILKKTYRTLGNAIVQDNLIQLLLNDIDYCGDQRRLTYFTTPGLGGLQKRYIAYRRQGFLCPMKHTVDTKPMIMELEKGAKTIGKAKISSEGLLMPFNIKLTNDTLDEKEISNGKEIASLFIEAMATAEKQIASNNPVMAILISSIPLMLMIVGIGVILYLSLGELGDSAVKILAAAERIHGSCSG